MTSVVTTAGGPEIDVDLLHRLFSDDTACDSVRAAEILGVSRQVVYKLHANTKSYMASAPRGARLPLRPDLFPLPSHPDSTDREPLWPAGAIYWFGAHTLRLAPDGTPQARPNPGKAPREKPPARPAPVQINLPVLRALQTQQGAGPLSRKEFAAVLGVETQTLSVMLLRTRRWLAKHPGRPLPLWPTLVPLPEWHPDSTQYRTLWDAGLAYRWGMISGRLSPLGEPVTLIHRGSYPGGKFEHPNPVGQFGNQTAKKKPPRKKKTG